MKKKKIVLVILLTLLFSCNKKEERKEEILPDGSRLNYTLVDGLKNGVSYNYDSSGTIVSSEEWENGVKHGLTQTYYKAGNLEAHTFYVNDTMVYTTEFSENGDIYGSFFKTLIGTFKSKYIMRIPYSIYAKPRYIFLYGNLDSQREFIDTLGYIEGEGRDIVFSKRYFDSLGRIEGHLIEFDSLGMISGFMRYKYIFN